METTRKRIALVPLTPKIEAEAAELRRVLGVTLVLVVLAFTPTIFGYMTTPPDKWFSGVVYNMHDTAQYLTWVREAGVSFFTENKLTGEPSDAVFVNLHWWIPGWLAHKVGLSFDQLYQLYRLISIPLLSVATYVFCSVAFTELRRRWFAFVLSLLTSGLGWIWIIYKYLTPARELPWPTDVYTTPGNAFWVMVASPHLTFAAALTISVILFAFLSVHKGQVRHAAIAAGMALFLGTGHIYDLVTVWAVLAVFGVLWVLRNGWSWRVFICLALVVIVSMPAALYWGWVASSAHPAWQQALEQYDNLGAVTPDPIHLVILLGGTFILAAATFDGVVPLKAQSNLQLLVKGWFITTLLLIYLPLHFRIMLLTGYTVPLAILATTGLFDRVIPWLEERLPAIVCGFAPARLVRGIPLLMLAFVSAINVYLWGWRLYELSRHDYPFFLYQDEVAGMRWLDANSATDEVVLSAFVTGHFIPGLAGNRVFLGNAVMTLDYVEKNSMIAAFYSTMKEAERRVLLARYKIRYVFYGPSERALGDYDPSQSTFLESVFSTPTTAIYRVKIDH